jgi:hypothetical protein
MDRWWPVVIPLRTNLAITSTSIVDALYIWLLAPRFAFLILYLLALESMKHSFAGLAINITGLYDWEIAS